MSYIIELVWSASGSDVTVCMGSRGNMYPIFFLLFSINFFYHLFVLFNLF